MPIIKVAIVNQENYTIFCDYFLTNNEMDNKIVYKNIYNNNYLYLLPRELAPETRNFNLQKNHKIENF